MKLLVLGCVSAIALTGAIAFNAIQPVASHITSVTQTTASTQTYTASDFFTLELPVGWTAQKLDPTYYMFWNDPPDGPGGGVAPVHVIKTDVTLVYGDFDTIVEQNDFLEDEGEEIVSYRQVQIDGRDAVQFHTQGGGWDFPDTFVTIVRYSDEQSILMASYFTDSHASSLPTIERLHQSLHVTRSQP
jgi:hypothetical protein